MSNDLIFSFERNDIFTTAIVPRAGGLAICHSFPFFLNIVYIFLIRWFVFNFFSFKKEFKRNPMKYEIREERLGFRYLKVNVE